MTCPISAPKRALTGSSLRRTVPRTRVRLGPPITAIAGSNNPSTRIPSPDPRCREKGPKSHREHASQRPKPVRPLTEYLHARYSRSGVPAIGHTVRYSARHITRPNHRSATRTVFLACHPPPSLAGHSDPSSTPPLPGPECRPSGSGPAPAVRRFSSLRQGWRVRAAACR